MCLEFDSCLMFYSYGISLYLLYSYISFFLMVYPYVGCILIFLFLSFSYYPLIYSLQGWARSELHIHCVCISDCTLIGFVSQILFVFLIMICCCILLLSSILLLLYIIAYLVYYYFIYYCHLAYYYLIIYKIAIILLLSCYHLMIYKITILYIITAAILLYIIAILYIRAFHGVALPKFPGGPAGLYLKPMSPVLNKCVHTWCGHHNTNFSQTWISVPIPHDLFHLCGFSVLF
jgi:hypothetical protein